MKKRKKKKQREGAKTTADKEEINAEGNGVTRDATEKNFVPISSYINV